MPVVLDEILQRDEAAKVQFDRWAAQFYVALSTLFLVVFVIQVIAFPTGSHLGHLAVFFLGAIAVYFGRDGIQKFMFASVFFGFTLMLYVNATIHGQSVDFSIIDPLRAAAISVTSQAALTMVAVIDRLWPLRDTATTNRAVTAEHLLRIENPIFVILIVAGLLDAAGLLSPILAESARFFLPIPIVTSFLRHGPNWGGLRLIALVGLSMVIAVKSNARSDLLNILLLIVFLYALFAKKRPSPLMLVLGYVVLRLLKIFSAVSLAVRPLRDDPAAMTSEFLARFLSLETVVSVLNPFSKNSSFGYLDSIQTGVNFAIPAFFRGEMSSLLDRLTLLPQMDVVTGRLDAPVAVDFSMLFRATILSAFPSFGQTKIEMLGDELVWDLALRSRESIGRPMITAQAEAWALGGHLAVFVTTFLLFLAWAINYRITQRFFGFKSVTVAVSAMLIVYATFSTTLLSVSVSLFRMPIQTIVILWATMILTALFRRNLQTLNRSL